MPQRPAQAPNPELNTFAHQLHSELSGHPRFRNLVRGMRINHSGATIRFKPEAAQEPHAQRLRSFLYDFAIRRNHHIGIDQTRPMITAHEARLHLFAKIEHQAENKQRPAKVLLRLKAVTKKTFLDSLTAWKKKNMIP